MELPHVLKAQDIAAYLNISRSKAYSLLNKKGFPTINFDGMKRVERSDFMNWLNGQKQIS